MRLKTTLISKLLLLVAVVLMGTGTASAADITDVINHAATSSNLGNTGTSSWVNNFTVTGTSGATYNIRSMGTKDTENALQWNANGYLYMTTAPSGYKLKSVTITTTANKNISIYAQSSAYSAAPSGTALATLAATSSSATYTFTSDYTYLALKGTSSSTSVTSISIVWEEVNAVATTTTINATGITNTDVYSNTAAGSLSASVNAGGNVISGATVVWSGDNDKVATINESTGDVTLVAAGTVTFTASYEGVTGQYQASYATYEMTVTSSAPYVQPTEFDINLNNSLFGTNHSGTVSNVTDENPIVGEQDNVTVTYAGGGNHYVNDSHIRFYPNNKLTFEAPSGYVIEEIVFTSAGTWAATITTNNGNYDSSTKKWTGSVATVVFTGSGSSRCDMSKAAIKLGTMEPSIAADNVVIASNATSGSFDFTVNNPVTGGVTTASENVDWISNATVSGNSVTFTTTANEASTLRSGVITLTYTYGINETVTKDVTITQAKNLGFAPVVVGSGIYQKITSTSDLEAGKRYLIVNEDDKAVYAGVSNSNIGTCVTLPISEGKINNNVTTDAATPVVLQDAGSDNWYIMDGNNFLYWTSGNNLYSSSDDSQTGNTWTIVINDDSYYINNADQAARYLQYNKSNPRFACYTNTQQDVVLYKEIISPTTATITLASACTDDDKYYGTYSNSSAFVVPAELTVSEISVSNGTLTVTNYETGAVVPANTGVMVSSTTSGDHTVTLATGGTSVLGNGNMLKPSGDAGISAANMNVAETKFYRLTMHNGNTIGFWWGAENGAAFALAANKAYLAVPNSAAGARMGLWFGDDATAIENVNLNNTLNGEVYDLQGRRVAQPQKGLYIVNGRKVVVK